MEKQEDNRTDNSSVISEQSCTDIFNNKIKTCVENYLIEMKILKKFSNGYKHSDIHIIEQSLSIIRSEIFSYQFCDLNLAEECKFRLSILDALLKSDALEILSPILFQLFDNIFDKDYTRDIDNQLSSSITTIMMIFLNFSDASSQLGRDICKNETLLKLYCRIIREFKDKCLDETICETLDNFLKYSLGTVYNTLIYEDSKNLRKIRDYGFLPFIQDLIKSEREHIRRLALFTTAYIANEDESQLFKIEPECITYLIDLLKQALESKLERSGGQSVNEIAKGIDKLSKNDQNKQLLVDLGILPVLKILINRDSHEHKKTALSILWNLSFDDRNKEIIKKEFADELSEIKKSFKKKSPCKLPSYASPAVLVPMSKMSIRAHDYGTSEPKKNSQNRDNENTGDCKKMFDGLMWTLDEKEKQDNMAPKGSARSIGERHVMISYCWANAELVLKIYDNLKKKQYKLWIDKYNMADNENLMESMAKAVENSDAVIICISQNYKDSANCRAEAQYAQSTKKPLIPVMVQKKYRPDGWLGFCITGLQYCDFIGRYTFGEAFSLLDHQLSRITATKTSGTLNVTKVDYIDPITTNKDSQTKSPIKEWTNFQTKNWFKDIGLEQINWKDHYTGLELDFLKCVADTAKESFYQICRLDLNIRDLRDLRVLCEALHHL